MDSLLDEISDDEFNHDERLPYWATIWPSAVGLSEYLSRHIELGRKSVLELGCGLGLAGIVSAKRGANVTFSDYEKPALDFVSKNARLNRISSFDTNLLDWREPDLKAQFDIIIAADVLYEDRFLEPVLNTLVRYLKENGKAYIAEPNRNVSRPFFDLLKKQGYSYKKYLQRICYKQIEHFIAIYEIN